MYYINEIHIMYVQIYICQIIYNINKWSTDDYIAVNYSA